MSDDTARLDSCMLSFRYPLMLRAPCRTSPGFGCSCPCPMIPEALPVYKLSQQPADRRSSPPSPRQGFSAREPPVSVTLQMFACVLCCLQGFRCLCMRSMFRLCMCKNGIAMHSSLVILFILLMSSSEIRMYTSHLYATSLWARIYSSMSVCVRV